MTEPSHTAHTHHARSHSQKKVSGSNVHSGYVEPVLYFSGAVLLLVFAKLIHISLLSPALGAIGIIILAMSKIWKYKPGIILSVICIFGMTMAYVWQWVDSYALAVLSAEVTSNTLFVSGLSESLILTFMVWIYHRILNSIHMHMGQKWFVKSVYLKFLKLLFFFILFLFLFWAIAFVVHKARPLTHLSTQDSAMIAGALALLASGIPAIMFLTKGSLDEQKRRQQRYHHRHGRNTSLKNSGVG